MCFNKYLSLKREFSLSFILTLSKVFDRLCHPSSVDLSNTAWTQKELIKQLARNACGSRGTKTAWSTVTSIELQVNMIWRLNRLRFLSVLKAYSCNIGYLLSMYLPKSHCHKQDVTQGQFLSLVWIQTLPTQSLRTQSTLLFSITRVRRDRFMPFPKTLVQTALSRIWTQVANSISYDKVILNMSIIYWVCASFCYLFIFEY